MTIGPEGPRRSSLPLEEVEVHGWSPDNRFVVFSAWANGWVLVFYDSATGRLYTTEVDGKPVAILAMST